MNIDDPGVEGGIGTTPDAPPPSDESLRARVAQRDRVQQFLAKVSAQQGAKANASATGSNSPTSSNDGSQTAPEETDEQILAYSVTFFSSILWPVIRFIARRFDPRNTLDDINSTESGELASAFLPWFRRYSTLRLVAKTLGAPALLMAKIRAKLHTPKTAVVTTPPSAPPPELSKTARNVTSLRFDPAEHAS